MGKLPEYIVKVNSRAKHVGLRVTYADGLIVTIPPRFNQKKIPSILLEKLDWVEESLSKIQSSETVDDLLENGLPHSIGLGVVNSVLPVYYRKTSIKNVKLNFNGDELVLYGNISNLEACNKRLKEWLKEQADIYLTPWVEELSTELEMPISNIVIRNQKGRWGSCSSEQEISLNAKLMFLPEDLVQYVLIHELCHTVEMNHSKSFWNLVNKFDPDYRLHAKIVRREAWQKYVPSWA